MRPFTKDSIYYAKLIKQGNCTVRELVDRAIENIEQLNPRVNAVVVTQFSTARQIAKQYDANLHTYAQLPPFYGVPILLKDLGQTQADQLSTNGMQLFKNRRAEITDHFVATIIELGFIIVGRTNTPELGLKDFTHSHLYGECLAAADSAYNSGGSSGGAATALKLGMVPLVAASDGGGSIRIPAAIQGLIGLKPSRGAIVTGPRNYRNWQGAVSNFFLTKTARETRLLLELFARYQPEAPYHVQLTPCHSPQRIGYLLNQQSVLQEAITQLESEGLTLIPLEEELYPENLQTEFQKMVAIETAATLDLLNQPVAVLKTQVEPTTYKYWELGQQFSAYQFIQSVNLWDQWTCELETVFKERKLDLLVTPALIELPVANQVLPRWEEIEAMDFLEFATFQQKHAFKNAQYLNLFNLTGHPALTLSLGDQHLQFVGPMGHDHCLIELLNRLEQRTKQPLVTVMEE